MCGRYVQARATGDLAAALHADHDPDYQHQPSWNIAPTDTVPIVVETLVDGEILRRLGPARWGLLPPWAKDRTFSSRTFNARSETVTTKPSFRSAVRRKRAIVPAEGYYEWRTEGRTKTPHLIRPADGSLMLFAGLWESWTDGEETIVSTTILTGPAPTADDAVLRELGALHDRTPLAMTPTLADQWVQPGEPTSTELEELLDEVRGGVPEVARLWEIHPVGPEVGNVRNNGPELMAPVPRLFFSPESDPA
ncbi:SOS response-associated peptidase [Nesterenkonia sp. NBAIMH1]|uniref:SOS response-associated peptidase n=1 Tax=Nesterenkonia sp. NBAIMH1 TaxID=2600320 RepID=UPI0011B4AF8A|nr:SOS response-associated peptidase [Nesterenkonia sp. NBAIMH1]